MTRLPYVLRPLSDIPPKAINKQIGALPWRTHPTRKVKQVMLITSRGSGRWILPKGWPIKGKADYETAAIEAVEEAGVSGNISVTPLGSYHSWKQSNDPIWGRWSNISLYPLEVISIKSKWKESQQRKRKWFTLTQAASFVDEAELALLLLAFHDSDPMQVPRVD